MAKAKAAATTTPAPAPAVVTLVYIGPSGQTSPVFGALAPGQPYTTADATFAAYLAATHPDYWQLGSAKE